MKKTIILFTCILLAMSVNAQEKRKIDSFEKLNVVGSFDVTIVNGKGELTIRTSDESILQYIITEVKDNTLYINFKKGFKKNTKDVNIEVPFEVLNAIKLAGSGSITSKDPVNSTNLTIQLTGSGDISLNINSKNINVERSGSGDMVLKGKTVNLEAKLVGSGDLDAFGLISENTEISVSGSGDGKVYASENIMARVIGSGDINYKGNPKKEDTKVSGSGGIHKV